MKKSKLAVILVSCIAVLAVILFGCSFLMLKKAQTQKEEAQKVAAEMLSEKEAEKEAKKEVEQEAKAEEKAVGADRQSVPDEEAVITPEETKEDGTPSAGEAQEIVFQDVTENIFILKEAPLYREPFKDSEVLETAPVSKLFKRTGVSDQWSRLDNNGQVCYVVNELISTETPAVATDGSLVQQQGEEPGTAAVQSGSSAVQQESGKVIIVDPGHQAQGDSSEEPIGPNASVTKPRVSTGTSGSTSGLDEYELNLQVALKLRDELVNRGYTVYMTRETHDVSISNKERAEFAAEKGGDILVRIHANGSEDSSVSGALTMAPSDENAFLSADLIAKSQELSQNVIDAYVAATGFNNQGVYITDEMSGINWATMPVTIVEMGYMSNPTDDAAMADPSMQTKIVTGISDGIDQYFSNNS